MSVQFVIGRAGVGKTHWLHEQLVRHVSHDPLERPAIVLVPKQATFQTQRLLAGDDRLKGFTRVRVIAPDDLAELALVETGHPAGARLDSLGRTLVLGYLLKKNADQLKHFSGSSSTPGLAAEFDQAFCEFEQAGRDLGDVADVNSLIADASPADTTQKTLSRKLTDLRHVYTLYQTFLTERGFDPFRRQQLVPEAIHAWKEVVASMVIVDDFLDLTVYERTIITALAQTASSAFIALTLDPSSPVVANPHTFPDELSLFRRTEMALRKLTFSLIEAGVTIEPPVLMRGNHRFVSDNIRHIEQAFENPVIIQSTPRDITLAAASDDAAQIEIAARCVRHATAQKPIGQGLRYRDICVLARSVDDYAPLIERIFNEHHIAHFIDRRRPAVHHPLMKTVQALLQIVRSVWSHESVFELARAGLTPLEDPVIDLLQDYVAASHLPPGAWLIDQAWNLSRKDHKRRPRFTPEELHIVRDARKQLIFCMNPLGLPTWGHTSATVQRLMTDLFITLRQLTVEDKLSTLIQSTEALNNIEQANEHELIWTRFVEVCDRLCDLLGDTPMTGIDFAEMLSGALSELELAIAPPTLDQVLVGSVDRTRVPEVKLTILLGMNASEFPRCGIEPAVLNDADRRLLQAAGVDVTPGRREQLVDERLLGYRALTRASTHLTLIRRTHDEKANDLEASPFWELIQQMFPALPVRRIASTTDAIATPAQALRHLLVWARRAKHDAHGDDPDSAWLYQWAVAQKAGDTSALHTRDDFPVPAFLPGKATDFATLRNRVWTSLAYRNDAEMSPDVAGQLFASPLQASVSRFESFAACPFQHFARYGLRLQPGVERDLTAMDLGTVYHGVLERLVRSAIEARTDFAFDTQLTPGDITRIANEIGESLRSEVFIASARNRYTLQQIENAVTKLLRAQQHVLAHSAFRPAYTELDFGPADTATLKPLELTSPRGTRIILSGKIDRVDIDPQHSLFTVTDYKLAGQTLQLPYVAHGLMLQLLTYLLVLQRQLGELHGKPLTPAAAFYVKVLRSIESVSHPSDAPAADSGAFHKKSRPRGVINAQHAGALVRPDTQTNINDVLSVIFNKDGALSAKAQDAVESNVFLTLIDYVRQQIEALADRVTSGDVSVTPYRLGDETPCARCDYARVCRIDRVINFYRILPPMKSDEAVEKIRQSRPTQTPGDHV
jgi:ATP-dependent helicase/nuclease subunit B